MRREEKRRGTLRLVRLGLAAATVSLLLTGARRPEGGCSGGRGLWAIDDAGRETWNLSGPAVRTRTSGTRTLNRSTSEGARFPPIREIEWAGDTASYVDVYFDAPFRSFAGEDFAPMVRYRWVPGSFALVTNPAVDIANAALPGQIPIGQPTSIRHYDRGACSADVSWRSLAQGLIEDGLDLRVLEIIREQGRDGRPSGNWTITPLLRPEFIETSVDAFSIVRRYSVFDFPFGTWIEMRIRGRFQASGELRFILETVSVTADPLGDFIAVDGFESAIRNEFAPAVNERIPSIVGTVLESGGTALATCDQADGEVAIDECLRDVRELLPFAFEGIEAEDIERRNVACLPFGRRDACAIVPNFYRVHGRPEGIEAVLSEWSASEEEAGRGEADPLFPLLDTGGACDRTSTPPMPVDAGYFGTVFEIPPSGTPLPFGDEP